MACKHTQASIISSLTHQAIILHRNSYGHINISMYSSYSVRNTRYKTLRKYTKHDATTERGSHFHPTIGSVTPKRFTTSHPQARPRCFEVQSPASSSIEIKDEGYSPSLDVGK
jgi:hypothetical protein